jgi:hypothetical protein
VLTDKTERAERRRVSDDLKPAGYRPPPRRSRRRPGDPLFSFKDREGRQVDCELGDHGPFGVEVQFLVAGD